MNVSMGLGDCRDAHTFAYCNVITWADDPSQVEEKIRSYLARSRWTVLDFDFISEVDDESHDYSEDLTELADRASKDPHAILLGTFHTYKPN